jgi:hypothetical protein
LDASRCDPLGSLTTIYGFFFIFIATMIAASPVLRSILAPEDAVMFFLIALVLAVAIALVGTEIVVRATECHVYRMGLVGTTLMGMFVPIAFVFGVGRGLIPNAYWLGLNLSYAGSLCVFVIVVSMYLGVLARTFFSKR